MNTKYSQYEADLSFCNMRDGYVEPWNENCSPVHKDYVKNGEDVTDMMLYLFLIIFLGSLFSCM